MQFHITQVSAETNILRFRPVFWI